MAAQATGAEEGERATGSRTPPRGPCTPRRPWPLDDAELRFLDDLPEDLRHGFAQPGAAYRTTVRFSNAANVGRSRTSSPTCAAWRCACASTSDVVHDLLMTNFPVSHARDARQFVEFARATAGGAVSRLLGVAAAGAPVRPARDGADAQERHHGTPAPARQRVHRDLLEPRRADLGTHASRCATCCGPAPGTPRTTPSTTDPAYLSTEAARRLAAAATCAWSCASSASATRGPPRSRTPAVEWTEQASPPEPVAVLTIPQGDITTPEAQRDRRARSTRSRSTRGTPPTTSGRWATSTGHARRSTTPARPSAAAPAGTPRSRSATWSPAPPPGRCSRS